MIVDRLLKEVHGSRLHGLDAHGNIAMSGDEDDGDDHALGVREFVDFLTHNKKWWLTPIILVLLLLGVLIALGGTAAAPFIYTIF